MIPGRHGAVVSSILLNKNYVVLSVFVLLHILVGCTPESNNVVSTPTPKPTEEVTLVPLPNSVVELIVLLEEGSVLSRIRASRKVVTLRDAELAVPALTRNLYHQDFEVREAAAQALGKLEEDAIDAVPLLIMALFDSSLSVREGAAAALGSIGDKRAVPALAQCLEGHNDPNGSVAYYAALAMEDIVGITFVAPPQTANTLNEQGDTLIVVKAIEWWNRVGHSENWID